MHFVDNALKLHKPKFHYFIIQTNSLQGDKVRKKATINYFRNAWRYLCMDNDWEVIQAFSRRPRMLNAL